MSEKSLEEVITEETSKRLELMNKKDYEFPEQLTKFDWVWIVILIVASMILILLCMMGVIV